MRRWLSWRIVGVTVLIVGVLGGIGIYYYAERIVESRLRPATIELLEERLNSRVELAAMKVTFSPTLSVRGEGLVIRHQGRTDIPPLITMRSFTIGGGLRPLWERRVDRVHVDGLELVIPPRRGADMPSFTKATAGKPSANNATEGKPSVPSAGDPALPISNDTSAAGAPDVFIGELIAENSMLTIMSKREDKGPRVFQIRHLRFKDFEFSKAVPFEAAITNPTPFGEIEAKGEFGPWASAEPSTTPVKGTFLFDADLGTIKGIGGALHAEGDFSGPLEYIRSSGRTRTEGFHLSSGGTKFPLVVDYDAIVDGTNGDTRLERVDALLGTSRITARGAIYRAPDDSADKKGRRITLDTTTRGGRLEDFVMLTTRTKKSPMTGVVNVDARLDIPPGEAEVIERMDLGGTFNVGTARFTSETIQSRVDELSRRGMGRPTDETIDDVASNLKGVFTLNDARLELKSLSFNVEGASVRLAGSYDVKREWLDFSGELRLQASASQTQTGWKRLLLRVFDPMLDAPGAGTVLPISITGPRDQPKFAADLKKAILR
jgi:hypothetical protein